MKAFNWAFTTRSRMTLWAMVAAAPLWALSGNANVEVPNARASDELLALIGADVTPEEAYERGKETFFIDTAASQEKAARWLRNAAARGHVDAQHDLALLLCRGQFTDAVLTPEALEWFVKAALAGSMLSQNQLGVWYDGGDGPLPQDYDEARYWFELSAAQGGAYAMINLGRLYRDGRGVEVDEAKALEFYRRSWDEGDAAHTFNAQAGTLDEAGIEGLWQYARMLRFSGHVYMENQQEEAVQIFHFLAVDPRGSPEAQTEYGLALANGIGVERNEYEAVRWYLKAAARRNTDAMNNLAVMYGQGRGADVDHVQAFHWALKAAKLGHLEAQAKVGAFIWGGTGTEEDREAGMAWWLLAAERGHKGTDTYLAMAFGDNYRELFKKYRVEPGELFARYTAAFE